MYTVIVFNSKGEICRIVLIDNEDDAAAQAKLANDTAFHSPGGIQVQVLREECDSTRNAAGDFFELVKVLQPRIENGEYITHRDAPADHRAITTAVSDTITKTEARIAKAQADTTANREKFAQLQRDYTAETNKTYDPATASRADETDFRDWVRTRPTVIGAAVSR